MSDKESLKAKYTEQELRQTRLEIVSMSLSDNIFFVNVMKNTRLFSHILSLLLGERMDVVGPIKEVKTEHKIDLSYIDSRSVRLDAVARDSNGTLCHIEMENIPSRMSPKRGRYYSAASDVDSLYPGSTFDELKKSFHLFLVDGDAVGNSQIINIFSRKNQFGEEYGDESYIYVVNINTMTDDALGRMLRSIKEPDPEKIEDDIVRDVVSSAKGDNDMELSIHDTKIRLSKEREEALFREGLRQGIEKGFEQGIEQGIEKGVEKGVESERIRIVEKALKSGSDKSTLLSFLMISEEELDRIIEKIQAK